MTEKVETMAASCARVDRETMASTKKSEKLVSHVRVFYFLYWCSVWVQ